MACPVEDFDVLCERLKSASPDSTWDLACFYDCDRPSVETARIIRPARSIRFAASLLWSTFVRPYSAIYIACVDTRRPAALMPLVEYVSLMRAGEKWILDRNGARTRIGLLGVFTILSLFCVPPLLLIARLVTSVGRRLQPAVPPRPSGHVVAIAVPLLPDISHTFVFREVLELKRRHPDYRILILEEGDQAVWHRDAAALRQVATVVPRTGPAGYLLTYLCFWLTRPRAMAHVVRFFEAHTASFGPGARSNDRSAFLRLEYLHHSNYLTLGLMFADWLRREDIGYLHVYGSTYPAVRALVARELLGLPFSLSTFVDFDYPTPFHMLPEKVDAAVFVVACTDFCLQRLLTRFPQHRAKMFVVHHALPPDFARCPEFRPRDGRSRLVYVGRFVQKKGLDTLIDACGLLRRQGVEFSCHLYGNGDAAEELAARARATALDGALRFEGPIPNERFYSTMNPDDIFVCPSRYLDDGERDGIPVSLIEAMAAGITVVSTTVSGIPELVDSGRNGYLVPPDDPEQLAATLAAILTDPEKRRAIAEPARLTVQLRFALEPAVDLLDSRLIRETQS
jgi:colanic acid/amylovoran biosynthesis glycosyltransferase